MKDIIEIGGDPDLNPQTLFLNENVSRSTGNLLSFIGSKEWSPIEKVPSFEEVHRVLRMQDMAKSPRPKGCAGVVIAAGKH